MPRVVTRNKTGVSQTGDHVRGLIPVTAATWGRKHPPVIAGAVCACLRDPMGFVNRELERIAVALRERQPPKRQAELYAAQQALCWALDPDNFASPLTMALEGRGAATGTQGD